LSDIAVLPKISSICGKSLTKTFRDAARTKIAARLQTQAAAIYFCSENAAGWRFRRYFTSWSMPPW
jgi:hypothetical protein